MSNTLERYKAFRDKEGLVAQKRARAEEKLESAKKRLTEAVQAAAKAGYKDPSQLGKIRDEKEAQLNEKLSLLEGTLSSQEEILRSVGL